MARPAPAGAAAEGGQVQARQAAGTSGAAEAHSNWARRAEEAATPRSGAVVAEVSECEGGVGGATESGEGAHGKVSAERSLDQHQLGQEEGREQ